LQFAPKTAPYPVVMSSILIGTYFLRPRVRRAVCRHAKCFLLLISSCFYDTLNNTNTTFCFAFFRERLSMIRCSLSSSLSKEKRCVREGEKKLFAVRGF